MTKMQFLSNSTISFLFFLVPPVPFASELSATERHDIITTISGERKLPQGLICLKTHDLLSNLLAKFMKKFETNVVAPPIVVLCASEDGYDTLLMDGYIYFSAKIVTDSGSDDEVAFILAHEFGHHALDHPKWISEHEQENGSFLEQEADKFALSLMKESGYDAFASIDAIIALKGGRWGKRIMRLEEMISTMGYIKTSRTLSENLIAAKGELMSSQGISRGHTANFANQKHR